jgi:Trypsin-like peptidase domain
MLEANRQAHDPPAYCVVRALRGCGLRSRLGKVPMFGAARACACAGLPRRQRSVPGWGGYAAVVAATALFVVAGCGSTATTTTTVSDSSATGSSGAAISLERRFVSVIKRVAPEVVQVSTPQGLGSGVVFDKHGDIVTNAHVVSGGGPLRVTDARGRSLSATLVGTFVPDDLAVVHAHGTTQPPATFANSDQLEVGDIVLAIWQPARVTKLGDERNRERARANGQRTRRCRPPRRDPNQRADQPGQ